MPREFPEQRDPQTQTPNGETGRADLDPADLALLESATAESRRDPADRQPGTLDDDDDVEVNIRTEPMSDVTGVDETSGYEETADGLDDTEETVRQQAEDRATGDHEDYIA